MQHTQSSVPNQWRPHLQATKLKSVPDADLQKMASGRRFRVFLSAYGAEAGNLVPGRERPRRGWGGPPPCCAGLCCTVTVL